MDIINISCQPLTYRVCAIALRVQSYESTQMRLMITAFNYALIQIRRVITE